MSRMRKRSLFITLTPRPNQNRFYITTKRPKAAAKRATFTAFIVVAVPVNGTTVALGFAVTTPDAVLVATGLATRDDEGMAAGLATSLTGT